MMRRACEQQDGGYVQHVLEIREYATLVASVLGCDISMLEGEERIRACHELLEQHPYAYPLALELSLQLPAAMAITWLRMLCAVFYSIADVQDEVDAFLVWRMSPAQALATAVRHAGRRGWFLQSVQRYLDEKHPLLGRYVRRRRHWDVQPKLCLAARWDGFWQKVYRWVWPSDRDADFRFPRLLSFYLHHDISSNPGNVVLRFLTWGVMRLVACRVGEADRDFFRREWANLPYVEIPRSREGQSHAIVVDVVTVIWGEAYVQRFLNLNAPSLLAPGNIPALAARNDVRLVFYTTSEDRERLLAHPLLGRLGEHAALRFVFIERILKDMDSEVLGMRFADKYSAMTAAHNHCLRSAALEDRYVFCNFPDIVWQKDFMTRLMDMVEQGKKQIFAYSGPYASMESMREELESMTKDGMVALDNATLRTLCQKHRHPFALLFYEGAPLRYFGALMRLFRVRDEGLVAHMACHVPVLLKPNVGVAVRGTIDFDYPLSPGMQATDIEIVRDNAMICMASLDPELGQNNAMRWPPYNDKCFAADFRTGTRLWNRIFFSLPCRFYGGSLGDEAQWRRIEDLSRAEAAWFLRQGGDTVPVPPVKLFLSGVVPFLRQ